MMRFSLLALNVASQDQVRSVRMIIPDRLVQRSLTAAVVKNDRQMTLVSALTRSANPFPSRFLVEPDQKVPMQLLEQSECHSGLLQKLKIFDISVLSSMQPDPLPEWSTQPGRLGTSVRKPPLPVLICDGKVEAALDVSEAPQGHILLPVYTYTSLYMCCDRD